MEDIDETCSLLNGAFPSSQLTITSPMLGIVTPARVNICFQAVMRKGKLLSSTSSMITP